MRRHAPASGRTTSPARGLARLGLTGLLVAGLQLAGCGGGGPDAGTSPFPTDSTSDSGSAGSSDNSGGTSGGDPNAAATAQACAPTNPYRADALEATTVGSLDNEKAWLRGAMSALYLWYDEIPSVSFTAAAYSNTADVYGSLDAYFNAQRTTATTASGARKDRFSFTYPTRAWNDLMGAGVSAGYGINWHLGQATPPRNIRVAWVEPGSPADLAGIRRGDTLVSVDGFGADTGDLVGVNGLNDALFPSVAGVRHQFTLSRGGLNQTYTLSTTRVTSNPVPQVSVLDTAAGKVGYLLFNDHMASAEAPLIDAITRLSSAGVTDLVLDLRYNGGGYLYIASELAYMIAGPGRTGGKVFESLQFNSQRAAETADPSARTPFHASSQCLPDSSGNCQATQQALPTLNLSRVTVLTGNGTCSASEAIINGLRGVDVDVRLIGDTTCGKPYGFSAHDNCGISYFPIEFKGVNAKGFGDYPDGFSPTCAVADDFDHALGDTAERQLAGAITHLQTGSCPVSGSASRARAQAAPAGGGRLLRGPERESRILRPRPR